MFVCLSRYAFGRASTYGAETWHGGRVWRVWGNRQLFVMTQQVKGHLEVSLFRNAPGGPLVSKVGYHPRKKIHVIRVVFKDQAMYARTSFRGAKTCKIGKKGMFLVILTNFGIDMTLKLRKTHAKKRNALLGSKVM